MPKTRNRVTNKGGRNRSPSRDRNANRSGQRSQDAIALLKSDHAHVKELLSKLQSDRNSKESLLKEIENEVKVHTQVEEEIFYPAFRDSIPSEADMHLYFEAVEEHHVVDLVLDEIGHMDTDSVKFDAKAKVLKDLIEHHASEEEKQMFPKARKTLGTDELRNLGEQIENRKQALSAGMQRTMKAGRRAPGRQVA
jgi:hemerythrin superfamily protein